MIRFFSLILLALFLALAFIPLDTPSFFDVDRYRPRVRELLENISGHKVQLEKIVYNPLNGLFTLELHNLEIEPANPDNPPLLLAPKVLLGIRAISLLLRQPELSTITIVNPQINIVASNRKKLLDRAQAEVLASDQKMTEELGQGLTGLTLGKISIQNGMLTLIDRERSSDGTLIIDHIHLGLHALSPRRASPLTATARIHNIPFTVNGQVGPLPASLDPLEMPLLLSFDAKATGLADLTDLFPDSQIQARLSRGYLTTMLHGTLNSGLQTSSWIQLDKIELANVDSTTSKGKTSYWNLGVGHTKTDSPSPMDIAFRQKSLLHFTRTFWPILEFEEFFVYLDGKPVMEARGTIYGGLGGAWDLQFNILDSFDFAQLPSPQKFPLAGKVPTGTIFLKGSWPESVEMRVELNLGSTTIHLPPFIKAETTPLIMTATAQFSKERFHIQSSQLTNPDDPTASIDIDGLLYPTLALQGTGRWQLAQLSDYFPILTPWNPSGDITMDLVLTTAQGGYQPDRASGNIQVRGGRIKNLLFEKLETPFRWISPELRLPQVVVDTGSGRMDGFITVIANDDTPPTFIGMVTPSGVSLEKIPLSRADSDPKLEGLVFGTMHFQGILDDRKTPESAAMTGHGQLHIKPGRITGIDPATLFKQPSEELTISNPDKSLYWDHAQAKVRWNHHGITITDLHVQGSDFSMNGKGHWSFNDRRWFNLRVKDGAHPWERDTTFPIHIEGDDITMGFRVMPSKNTVP